MMGRRGYISSSMKSQTCADSKMWVSASMACNIFGLLPSCISNEEGLACPQIAILGRRELSASGDPGAGGLHPHGVDGRTRRKQHRPMIGPAPGAVRRDFGEANDP